MTTSTELPVTALTQPSGDDTGSFFDDVVVNHATQVIKRFLDGAYPLAREQDSALFTLLRAATETLTAELAWHPSFGALHTAVVSGRQASPEVLAGVGLRLSEVGAYSHWQVDIPAQSALRFDSWPLPPCTRLEVLASGSTVEIRTHSDASVSVHDFTRCNGRWMNHSGLTALPQTVGGGTRATILRRQDLLTFEAQDIAEAMDDGPTTLMEDNANDALAVIHRSSNEYSSWVAKVITFIAPWRVTSSYRPTGSGSSSFAPGLVGVGNHNHAPSLAESLVHEASHHYYYVAMKLGALHDGSDESLYPNPFFGRERPIDRILLAYHAFTNILLFCRAAGRLARADSYFARRESEVADGLEVMEEALAKTVALTPLGRTIFDALRQGAHQND